MRRYTGMLIAAVGFGVAITIFGVAVVDAMRVDTAPRVVGTDMSPTDVTQTNETPTDGAALPTRPPVAPSASLAGEVGNPASIALGRTTPGLEAWVAETTSPRLPRIELERAVSQDPFQPDRRAPAQRYVLPGQRRVFAAVETREPTPAPEFRVVGSARIGAGGVALVQVDDGDLPIVVSVGESIEGYRLVSVTEDGATLAADGGTWALSVVEPREERRRGNNNRGNNDRGRNTRGGGAEQEVAAQLQQLIEGGLQGLFTQGRVGFRGRGGGGFDFSTVVGRGRRGGGGGGQ